MRNYLTVDSFKKKYITTEFFSNFALLQFGLFIFSFGIIFAKQAALGLSPWDVFHMGLSLNLPITFGQASQLTGLALIALSWFLGVRPGIGTLCNMFFIGLWIDLVLGIKLIPELTQASIIAQLSFILLSLVSYSIGGALYIKAKLGTGPRDSLMMALVQKTNWRVSVARICIEVVACLVGWLLGGPVGVGTVLLAFGIGPAIGIGFKVFKVEVKKK
jgi:uncharacterized protein